MLKKSFENIDQRAKIPEGIEFRKDPIWDNIQKNKTKKKSRKIWLWSAASLIPLILFAIWQLNPSDEFKENYILTTVTPNSTVEVRDLDLNFQENKPEKSTVQPKILKDKLLSVTEKESVSEDSSAAFPTRNQSKTSWPTIVFEETKEETEVKKLSPSAEALKNALAKTKEDGKTEERIVVEKLTFEQMIQARKNYFLEKNTERNAKKDDE
jgi:preprotein translocase subunit SecF